MLARALRRGAATGRRHAAGSERASTQVTNRAPASFRNATSSATTALSFSGQSSMPPWYRQTTGRSTGDGGGKPIGYVTSALNVHTLHRRPRLSRGRIYAVTGLVLNAGPTTCRATWALRWTGVGEIVESHDAKSNCATVARYTRMILELWRTSCCIPRPRPGPRRAGKVKTGGTSREKTSRSWWRTFPTTCKL